jgi:hypothetical protein
MSSGCMSIAPGAVIAPKNALLEEGIPANR